jgi:hypothetical protein
VMSVTRQPLRDVHHSAGAERPGRGDRFAGLRSDAQQRERTGAMRKKNAQDLSAEPGCVGTALRPVLH